MVLAQEPTLPQVPVRKASESSASDTSDEQASTPRSFSSLEKEKVDNKSNSGYLYDVKSVEALAPSETEIPTPGRALLVALGISKGGRGPALDAVSELVSLISANIHAESWQTCRSLRERVYLTVH